VRLQLSPAEIKTAIEQLSFEDRAELAAWLHGSPRRVRPVADWKMKWDPPSLKTTAWQASR